MEKLSLSISLSQKVNTAPYESADVFVSLSGVTEDTTQEEIDNLLNGKGALAYSKLVCTLKSRVAEIRSKCPRSAA